MKLKSVPVYAYIMSAALVLMVVVWFFDRPAVAQNQYKILDYGEGVCTDDKPPTSCGDIEVRVQDSTGRNLTYYIQGFDGHERDQYDRLSAVIRDAQRSGNPVDLTVNDKGKITAAE